MKPPVLILGASGFIGRHLVNHFAASGHQVTGAVRRSCDFGRTPVRVVEAPFDRSEDFLPLLADHPLVIHAASSTTPGASAAQPQIEGNLRTTLALLEAIQVGHCHRLIYLSSGGTLYGHREAPAKETDPILPRSYHGAGKAAAEHFINAWAVQYNGKAVILRPSNVYGPGQLPKSGFGVIPTALSAIIDRRPFTIWGDGSNSRDFLHIRDLVALIHVAAEKDLPAGIHTFNAGSGHAVSINSLLSLIEETTGNPLEREWQSVRRVDVPIISLDISRAAMTLGWEPKIALKNGLMDTWHWINDPIEN